MSPLVTTTAGLGAEAFGFTRLVAGARYYIRRITGLGTQTDTGGVFASATGEVTWAYWDNTSPHTSHVTTVSPSVTTGTSVRWNNSSGNANIWSVRKAGTSTYIATYPHNQNSSSELLKIDGSGSKLWSRSFTLSGTSGSEIALDSSENVYLVTKSSQNGNSNNRFTVAKYNSSGTIQWQRALQGDYQCSGWSIAATSAGDVYAAGTISGNTSPNLFIFKLNTSGTRQFVIFISNGNYQVRQIVTDSSGAFYVMWNNGTNTFVSKGSSSGVKQWERQIGIGSGYDMAIDPEGNLYVIAGGYTSAHYVFKYNSSGTIQWQRSIASSSGFMYAFQQTSKIWATADSVIFTLQETGNADPVVFKLPATGLLTGTYAMGGYNYTWAASSITETSATNTWLDFTSYYPVNSGTGTDAAGNINPNTFTPTTDTKDVP
jgi:hypothetical protein